MNELAEIPNYGPQRLHSTLEMLDTLLKQQSKGFGDPPRKEIFATYQQNQDTHPDLDLAGLFRLTIERLNTEIKTGNLTNNQRELKGLISSRINSASQVMLENPKQFDLTAKVYPPENSS